jgi:ribose-phosphate pyrophosphokinase
VGIDIDLKSRTVIIIDDMVSSGGTMIGASGILKEKGVKNVIFAYVHAVHSEDSFLNIKKANPYIILSTDTLKTNFEGLTTESIIPLISNWIKKNS